MAHHAQEDVRLLAMRGLYLYSSASFVFAIVENGIQPMIKQGTHCMHFCDDDDMNYYFCLFSIQQLTQQLNKCSGSPCSMRCEATSLWPSLQAHMRGLYLCSSSSFEFALVENGIHQMIQQGTRCMHFCEAQTLLLFHSMCVWFLV